MKTFYTLVLILASSLSVNAQFFFRETFEAPYNDLSQFRIDTAYHNNQWQIGKPGKIVFDSAHSLPNAIVTDTMHHVLPNDTSVFYLSISLYTYNNFLLSYFYKLDIDTATTVKMEISGDRGLNWIDPITEDTTYGFYWGGEKARLDTSAHEWKQYQLALNTWLNTPPGGYPVYPHYRTADTLLFRFTYITGNTDTTHEGWMMDDFIIQSVFMVGSANLLRNDKMVDIYPVPSHDKLYVHPAGNSAYKASVVLYNMNGQEVERVPEMPSSGFLDLSLPAGNYILKYSSGGEYAVKQLTIFK